MNKDKEIKDLENIIKQYKLNYHSNVINLLKYEENLSILRYTINKLEHRLDILNNKNKELEEIINNYSMLNIFNKVIEIPKNYFNYYISNN